MLREFGMSIAATVTPYDGSITVKDEWILSKDQQYKIRLRIYRPVMQGNDFPALLWMHGGGMMVGLPEQDDVQMKQIAFETKAVVFSVDYRLAPEHVFPVPVEDCYDALQWVYAEDNSLGIDPKRVAVGGASAGGGLAASLAIMAVRKGGPAIVHLSLTYPMLDSRNETKSSHEILDLGIWDRPYNLFGWLSYLGNQNAGALPDYAVPALADLSGLPPVFIAVGSLDLFRDEDLEFGLRAMAAGVSTELHFYHGAVHGFDWHIPLSAMTNSLLTKRILALKLAFQR